MPKLIRGWFWVWHMGRFFCGVFMLPDYPDSFWALAVFAVVLTGVGKAGFGGGIGILATPLMALTIPVTDAAAVMLPLLIACDVFAVAHYRKQFDRRLIQLMVPGAVVGIGVGASFFGYFMDNERILEMGLGGLSLAFIFFQATRIFILGILEKRQPHSAEGVLMGAVSGFTSTIAHAGGPPIQMYLLPQKLPRTTYVATTVIFFAILNQIKLIPYFGLDILEAGHLLTIALLSPLSFVGVRLGVFMNQRFTELWFNRVIYGILLIAGIQLIIGQSLIKLVFG